MTQEVSMQSDNTGTLAGRVALITGGGRGIGRATSLALAEAGAAVAVNWNRDERAANVVVDMIMSRGGRAIAAQASVANYAALTSMVDRVGEELGPIGILVNNGGIASRGLAVSDTATEEVEKVLAVHAIGPHALCRLVLPQMRTQDRGDIVMISSAAAHALEANGGPYNMGKMALEALAYTLAKEEVGNGIHVNIVAPGLVASDMGDRLVRAVSGGEHDAAAALDADFPFGHVCRPSEIADVVTFLVSPKAGYITGQRIVVDGGVQPTRG
jgi:NAD(P)-dependent dehydrogenase (short-subunit alcohol dehydrogenase family)